ncbi:MAG: VOC family protein [Bryobacterales bacterium]|nr:VOC family protein [Bryobacterales bacterium]
MPHIDSHPAGSFCWFELGTTDQNAAKTFYSTLFGWSANDSPMGPGHLYTTFHLDGRSCAAAYTITPEMSRQGVPPHWMVYVAVGSADDTASKAKELGGNVVMAPFDVMDLGRMAVIQDPAGAAFSIWQGKSVKGTGITGEPGTFCWGELSTSDIPGAQAFYSGLFGWKIVPGQVDETYLHIENGAAMIGGIPPAKYRNPNVPPHWVSYFLVTDCDAAAAKANDLGAKLLFGPETMEKVGRLAFVADPQSAVFAIFKPAH